MRILLIHQNFLEDDDHGGSRFNELTRSWSNMGHQITVLASMAHYNSQSKRPQYKNKSFVKNQQGQVTVWRCHVSETFSNNFFGRFYSYFSFMISATWAGLFKDKGKYDIILVTSPPLFVGITAYILSKFKKIPYLFEVRDLWPESAIDTGVLTNGLIIKLAYWVESFLYKKASKINVLTPAFRDHLIEKKNISPDKIIFIPNAADFTFSDQLFTDFDIPSFRHQIGAENKFIITYVGAHGIANHLTQVLDAAELLTDTNVLFLLIGEGLMKESLIKEAQARNITNVRFLPSVSKQEVFKYIMASDMGASVLKKVDTFKTVYSNKTFDYMACKKPILMAIDGVSRKLVEEADAGTYVEPENASEYNRIIRMYLNDPQLVKQKGENGYVFAKAHYDRMVLSKKYISYLQELVK